MSPIIYGRQLHVHPQRRRREFRLRRPGLLQCTPLTTVYNASNYLTATVPANLVHDAGGYGISVKNPGAASASNSLKFIVTANPFGTTITTSALHPRWPADLPSP